MQRLILFIAAIFIFSPLIAQPDGSDIHEYIFPKSVSLKDFTAIHAEQSYFGNYYIVQAKINGKGPYPFLFDTGATENYIRFNLAQDLELIKVREHTRSVLSSIKQITIDQTLFLAHTLELGGAKFTDVAFQSGTSERNEAKAFERIGVAGIIGITTFQPVLLTLDLGNERILLSKNELHRDLHGVTRLLRTKKIAPIILGSIQAEYYQGTHSFIIDTGNYSNFHLYLCEAIQPEPETHEQFSMQTQDFMMNEKRDIYTTLKGSIKIGNSEFENPTITYNIRVCQENWQFARDALIGANTLKKLRISIDQRNFLVQILNK